MKRLLLLGVLAAAVLVPAATAAPSATGTLRGTVVAKDRAHHALVVARPGGKVQMLVAPAAFGRTGVGRTIVSRYTAVAGRLPVALTVSLKGHAHKALVQGTIVRLVKRRAIINAGGSLLKVTLKAPKAQRSLALANGGPSVGDTVKVEVEIDDDGSLDAGTVVAADAPTGTQPGSGGEMEVRGIVSVLTPSTASDPGSITVTVSGLPVSCVIPANLTLLVKAGDLIELECRLTGDPAVWTVRSAQNEDDHADDGQPGSGDDGQTGSGDDGQTGSGDDGQTGSGDDGQPGSGDTSSEIEVRGTITAGFLQTSALVIVTPTGGGPDVACAIVPGSLSGYAAGDSVKMECVQVDGTLKLKEIEKAGGEQGDDDDDDSGDDSGQDDDDDDGGGDDQG